MFDAFRLKICPKSHITKIWHHHSPTLEELKAGKKDVQVGGLLKYIADAQTVQYLYLFHSLFRAVNEALHLLRSTIESQTSCTKSFDAILPISSQDVAA